VRATDGSAQHRESWEELRLLGLALLDRMEPGLRSVFAGLRVEAAEAATAQAPADQQLPAACQRCPVCSMIAVFQGAAPELGGRIAEHGDALLTMLRDVLQQPAREQPTAGGGC
jgi:hypothetical protein